MFIIYFVSKKFCRVAGTIKKHFIKLISRNSIKAKLNLFGLKFGLNLGVKDTKGNIIKFEGASPRDTMPSISKDFELFIRSISINSLFYDVLLSALDVYNYAIQANFYFHDYPYTLHNSLHRMYSANKLPLYIVSGFIKHTTAFIIGRHYIYECNRGAGSRGKTGIAIYKNNLFRSLEEVLTKLAINHESLSQTAYLDLTRDLVICTIIKMKPQGVGNCSIASHKAAIIAILIELLLANKGLDLGGSINIAYSIYKKFTSFYRNHQFNELYATFELEESSALTTTKTMILNMLSELVLRQHGKHTDTFEEERAKKILNTLKQYNQMRLLAIKYLDVLLIKKITNKFDARDLLDNFFMKFSIDLAELQKEYSLEDQIRLSIVNGDELTAISLIDQIGIKRIIKYSDCLGYNILHYAIAYGLNAVIDKVICRSLIKNFSNFEYSPLYYAVKIGNLLLVDKILLLLGGIGTLVIDHAELKSIMELAKINDQDDIIKLLHKHGIRENSAIDFILSINDYFSHNDYYGSLIGTMNKDYNSEVC